MSVWAPRQPSRWRVALDARISLRVPEGNAVKSAMVRLRRPPTNTRAQLNQAPQDGQTFHYP